MTLLVLTGRPGAGKTTLVMKIVERLKRNQMTVAGFYTEEVRQGSKRIGFDVVLLDGTRGPLARIRPESGDYRSGPFVGQYKVDIVSFEAMVLPLLQQQLTKPVKFFIIDEIGKMELFSKKFETAVKNLLREPNTVMLTTIPLPKGQPLPLVEHIRSSPEAKIYMVKPKMKLTSKTTNSFV